MDPCCDVYQKVTTILPNSSNAATLLLFCVCLYAIVGLAAGYAKEGRPKHIHHSQLRQIYGLCRDGFAFVKHGGSTAVRAPGEPQNSSPLLGRDRSSSAKPGPAEGTNSRDKTDSGRTKTKASKPKSDKQAKRPEPAETEVGDSSRMGTVARPTATAERALHEQREHGELHSSQAKIKVLGLQASATV